MEVLIISRSDTLYSIIFHTDTFIKFRHTYKGMNKFNILKKAVVEEIRKEDEEFKKFIKIQECKLIEYFKDS